MRHPKSKVGQIAGGCEKRGPIASSDSEDDVKITGVEEKSSYVFNPLTFQQHRVICERTSLEMHKEQLNHANVGEKMLVRPPKVRTVKGDGNCFFQSNGHRDNQVGSGPSENPSAGV